MRNNCLLYQFPRSFYQSFFWVQSSLKYWSNTALKSGLKRKQHFQWEGDFTLLSLHSHLFLEEVTSTSSSSFHSLPIPPHRGKKKKNDEFLTFYSQQSFWPPKQEWAQQVMWYGPPHLSSFWVKQKPLHLPCPCNKENWAHLAHDTACGLRAQPCSSLLQWVHFRRRAPYPSPPTAPSRMLLLVPRPRFAVRREEAPLWHRF